MTRGARRPGRTHLRYLTVSFLLLTGVPPAHATAQLSEPCAVACGLVLGATGVTVATGALVALGRHTGGISTMNEGAPLFGVSFVAFVGGGLALSGNGERQERAVYAAGIGALAGSLLWLGIESTLDESDGARKVAATLMGAAAGALVGGVYGALSQRKDGSIQASLLSVHIPF